MVSEKRIIISLISLTLFLTSLPYLLGYFITPPGMQFIGTVYNIDDYCNYLSWLRQTADGHFFLRNLFTTDPQKGLEFNLFFWLLGQSVRFGHLSPQAVLQFARFGGGLGLLWLVYRFYRHCLPEDASARVTAFGFACLSSGFGWVTWPLWHDKSLVGSPVDAWQPEAYLFTSLYTSALFTVSTLLIVSALYALILGEQTGRWKYPILAGLCGAILGNIHSYDVLHIAAAWGVFLVVWTIIQRGQGVALTWARSLLALALVLPTTLYQYYIFSVEAVFHERAEVKTLSPAFWHYILGYGIVFILALVAVALIARRNAPTSSTNQIALIFAACWAIAGFAVCYLPVAFQRKMLMGEHIPLCLLAGMGAAWLTGRLSKTYRVLALALLVLASFTSNALFLTRDMTHLPENRSETQLSPFLSGKLVDVYHWFRVNTPPDAAIVGLPGLCTYLPGEAGRAVWAGHWGETPHYAVKERLFAQEFEPQTPDAERQAFLLSTRAQYLFYPDDVSALGYTAKGIRHEFVNLAAVTPVYLTPVYHNGVLSIYQINR